MVELKPFTQEDMVRILKEPETNLLIQSTVLTEKVSLIFADDGIVEITRLTTEINRDVENIGTRRLHTIIEKLLEDVSFSASETPNIEIKIDDKYVNDKLGNLIL